jgi:hypothetical protein
VRGTPSSSRREGRGRREEGGGTDSFWVYPEMVSVRKRKDGKASKWSNKRRVTYVYSSIPGID